MSLTKINYTYEPPVAVLANPRKLKDLAAIQPQYGGFNPATGELQPLRIADIDHFWEETLYACDVFDTVAGALEAGVLDEEMWPSQLFAGEADFEAFLEQMAEYEMCHKFIEPWYQACCWLAIGAREGDDEYASVTGLSEMLREVVANDLPEQWA
jgi:hypothetical protein